MQSQFQPVPNPPIPVTSQKRSTYYAMCTTLGRSCPTFFPSATSQPHSNGSDLEEEEEEEEKDWDGKDGKKSKEVKRNIKKIKNALSALLIPHPVLTVILWLQHLLILWCQPQERSQIKDRKRKKTLRTDQKPTPRQNIIQMIKWTFCNLN